MKSIYNVLVGFIGKHRTFTIFDFVNVTLIEIHTFFINNFFIRKRVLFIHTPFFFPKRITSLRAATILFLVFIKERQLADENKNNFVVHEVIHVRQTLEMLIIPFVFLYLYEFFSYLSYGVSARAAYRMISFEQEAFTFEDEKWYLEKRPLFAWTNFFSLENKEPLLISKE